MAIEQRVPKVIKRNVPKLRYSWALFRFVIGKSSLHQMGWYTSAWKESSVDGNKQPVPWITYPAIHFLTPRINKKMRVFEYGSGNSTLWWAKKAKSVTAVEHEKYWQEKMQKNALRNAEIIHRPLGKEYTHAVQGQTGKFDVVIVDGRMRVECIKASVEKLTADGIIVWDNTDRDRYKPGIKFLEAKGFKHIDFYGPVPIDNVASLTSVFYRTKNNLGI